jgi:hypothetical protein
MRRVRENIFEVTYHELGQPEEGGVYEVAGLGEVFLDVADLRYIGEAKSGGYAPTFFVSRTPAMGSYFTVVARQRAA